MEECLICYSMSSEMVWKTLSCQHKLCNLCYLKLATANCPFCRKDITYNSIDSIKRQEYTNSYRTYTPPAQLTDIEFFIPNTQDGHTRHRRERRPTMDYIEHNPPFSRLNRKRFRNRRRDLTEEEMLERRMMIRQRCKKKWERKNGRLDKINGVY